MTPDFSIPDLSDTMSLAITAAARGWLWWGGCPRAELAQRHCHNEPTQAWHLSYKHTVWCICSYKYILLCWGLFSGPRKREICVLVAKHKKKSAATLKGVWSSALTKTAHYWCAALLHCLSIETWDRSSQIRVGKHLVPI